MSDARQQQIDAYLDKQMNDAERRAFEALVKEDMELAAQLEESRQAIRLIEQMRDMDIKEQVREVQAQYKDRPPSRPAGRVLLWKWISAAAAILLLAVIAYNWFQATPTDQLYAQHYEAYTISFGSRGEEGVQLAQASRYYQQKDYTAALPLFQNALSNKDLAEIRLALAICQLESQQFANARQTLRPLITSNDPVFGVHAQWYTAMAWLGEGQIEETRTILQAYPQGTGVFNQKAAQDLLERL
ncbi:MAG: tetratricopeptide repeat protein [Bacteroidota bacterium]